LHTNAIGSEPHEILRFLVLLLKWLREIFRAADIENPMSIPALFAMTAVGNQVNSPGFPKPCVQGKDIEPVASAGVALKRCFA
jgi:hypothetical protein